jgi:hypothetical protein
MVGAFRSMSHAFTCVGYRRLALELLDGDQYHVPVIYAQQRMLGIVKEEIKAVGLPGVLGLSRAQLPEVAAVARKWAQLASA